MTRKSFNEFQDEFARRMERADFGGLTKEERRKRSIVVRMGKSRKGEWAVVVGLGYGEAKLGLSSTWTS